MAEAADIYPPIILSILTFSLFLLFYKKRRETGVNALDWLMAIFGGTALLGTLEVLRLLDQDGTINLFIFNNVVDSEITGIETSLGTDPVRVVHLTVLLILYAMAENFLGDKIHSLRLFIISFLVGVYSFLSLYYVVNADSSIVGGDPRYIIPTSGIIPFGNDKTSADSFVFDLIQLFSVGMIFYVFLLQYMITDEPRFRRYLLTIELAVTLFLIASVLEVLEHISSIVAIDAFLTAIPTFLILAYFYLKNPSFVYLAPANITFLQLVSKNGEMLYAAELKGELQTSDFLIGPSLTSVNYIIEELLEQDKGTVEINKFTFNSGYILFQKVGDVRAIILTDRPAIILKRSMRFFLRQFEKHFSDQIENFVGNIVATDEGVSPDELFTMCIPIVQSKAFVSSFSQVN